MTLILFREDTFRGSFTGENAAKKYADQVGDILAQKPEKGVDCTFYKKLNH